MYSVVDRHSHGNYWSSRKDVILVYHRLSHTSIDGYRYKGWAVLINIMPHILILNIAALRHVKQLKVQFPVLFIVYEAI